MIFRDIKPNYPVFMLNKQNLAIAQGRVTAVVGPRVELNQKNGRTETVVDVSIDLGGKISTYTIPDSLSVTYANELVIAPDQQSIVNELEMIKNSAEQALAAVPYQQQMLNKSTEILAQLSPVYKAKQETEKRFTQLEGSVTTMGDSVARLEKMMSDFIKEFKG